MTKTYKAKCTFTYWVGDHVTATKHDFVVVFNANEDSPDFETLIKLQLRMYNFKQAEVKSYFVTEMEKETTVENKLYTIKCSFSYQFNTHARTIKTDYTMVLIRDNSNQLESEIIKRLVFNGYKDPKISKYSITNVKKFEGKAPNLLDASNISIRTFLIKCDIDKEEDRLELIKDYGKTLNLTELSEVYKHIENNFKAFKQWFNQLEVV